MTDDRHLSSVIETWLAEGPVQMPDRVFDTVADRIARQPQRPAWRLDWRRSTMNIKFAAVLAAVLVVAVVGYNLLPASFTGVGAPAPTASPTARPTATPPASATASPATTPSASPAAPILGSGRLVAGDYVLYPFVADAAYMSVTVTVPDGWQGFPDWAILGPDGTAAPGGIGIAFRQAAGVYDDPCHWDRAGTGSYDQPGETVVGPTVDDLVADLRANRSYVSTPPVDVVIGGYSGKQLDLQLPSDVDFATCDSLPALRPGPPSCSRHRSAPMTVLYVQGPGNRWRVSILDVAGSRVIVIVADYAGTPPQDAAAAQAIVDSIRFTP